MKIKFFFFIILLGNFILLVFVDSVSAVCSAPIRVAAMTTAPIIAAMNQLKSQIGGNNNGNGGVFTTGYRQIDWEVPNSANPDPSTYPDSFPLARDHYLQRGAIIDGVFDISDAGGSSSVFVSSTNAATLLFTDLHPLYAGEFQVFSGARIAGVGWKLPTDSFSNDGAPFIDVTFFLPGTKTPATVSGFGIVFLDADRPESATVQFFGTDGLPLAASGLPVTAPAIGQAPTSLGMSFVGMHCPERISRVRIKAGRRVLFFNSTDQPKVDMVAVDDIVFGEPKAVGYYKPADFEGDGFSDYVIFREGTWHILTNPTFTVRQHVFGLPCDIPVTGDYDGDYKEDLALYRAGTWFILPSSGTPPLITRTLTGNPYETPVSGDYNNDGITDIAVWGPDNPNTSGQAFFRVLFSPDFASPPLTLPWGQRPSTPTPPVLDFPFAAAGDPCP